MKDFAVGCCGSEERELQGSFLRFKIYSPNQKLAFGWKCSVNDVMKLSPLRCCDLSRSSGVGVEQEKNPPEPVLCSLGPPHLSQKQINANWHILHVAPICHCRDDASGHQPFINMDDFVLCVAAFVNILPGLQRS